MVITVDQGIKHLPRGFPKYTLSVNRFHRSLSLSSGFPLPPFFILHSSLIVCQTVCLPVLSSPRNRIQEETKSSDNHSSSSIRHHHLFGAFILSLFFFFLLAAPLGWASFAVSFYLFSDRDLQTLELSPSHFCRSTLYLGFSATSGFLQPREGTTTHRRNHDMSVRRP